MHLPHSKSPTYINPLVPPARLFFSSSFISPSFSSSILSTSHLLSGVSSLPGTFHHQLGSHQYLVHCITSSIVYCIKIHWKWSLSPCLTTSNASLRRVTSVTSTPTSTWPTMSTLVSLTCHHLPPVTCHHPSVTNIHLSHRPHTTWVLPLWLFILPLYCIL
jgi:hypothetical protein